MKKALLLIFLIFGTAVCFDALAQSWTTWSFSCSGNNCLKAGVDAAGVSIGKSTGIITGKGIVKAVQDVIKYFLGFLSVIAVIYVMWAGAQMLLFPSSEESSEKTKKIIISVFLGIVIIWFAYWIVSTLFYVLNNNQVATRMVPKAYAETQIRNIDFTTYSNKILALKTQIVGEYSPEITKQLSILIDGAYDHLPDRTSIYVNRQLYDRVKRAIADYDLHRADIDRSSLEDAVNYFLEQAQTFTILGQIVATPQNGDAPLSVTLQAQNIIDASGTTIPDTNFTWWLRTPDGPNILGRGKTINYEFKDEGTYTVYLTVNSASKNSRGFTDVISYEDQTVIEVGQPKLKYIVYFNEQLAADSIKIPTKESLQKVLIDATQTKFAYGYSILKTEWEFGNGKGATREGAPVIEAQDYKEGEYTIKLTLTRNDGEKFTKNIALKVGDPIASISVSNYKPNKGEVVVFEAKKATQEGVIYSWEVRKFGVEKPIFSVTSPRMEYAFKDIGRFSVSLVSNKDQVRDKETVEINIESRPPVVRFLAEMRGSETPNTYVFDGTSTYDPDFPDNQLLKYEWFVNDKLVQLEDTNTNNNRGSYTFTDVGSYQVELHVTDGEGKSASFKKTIVIKSLLSIQLNIRPQVVKRGERMVISAIAPETDIYEWTIGGKDTTTTETGKRILTFDKSGNYPLTLKVTDRHGNSNSIQRKLYVVDGDAPFSVIQLTTKSLLTETQKGVCSGEDATIVDRITPVSLVGDKSVNVGGGTTDLTYFWKIGLNSSSSQKNLTHTFDELGCEKISLTVSDKKTGASHTSEEWVKVVNIPPKFSDIQVTVENIDQDPLHINLRMEGAKDPDGNITSYTWYYYTSNDEQPQGFRITTKPETSFSLPKINGRYYFSVVLEDANGLKIDTRDISESKFSTPDLLVNQNISMPIIDFKVNTNEAKFGDPVEFSVNVHNALGQDISNVAEYRWDVDGDGFYDIKTSEPRFTYKYTIPGEYHPKVKVTHRGLSTTKFVTVNVTNRLNPQAVIQVIGDKIIAYNTSTGIIQEASWFADGKKISENKGYLVYAPEDGTFPSTIKLQISDGKDSQEASFPVTRNPKNKILIKKVEKPLIVLSNQSSDAEPVTDDILWSDPLKPLFLYMGESTGDIQYYVIDNDVDVDTDLSGGKNDDADNKGTASYRMGRPYAVPAGNKRTTIMRLSLVKADGSEIDSRQIRITRDFIKPVIEPSDTPGVIIKDPQTTFNLSSEDKVRLDKLQSLVKNIPEANQKEFQRYIDQLGDIWYDRADRAETLLEFSRAVDGSSAIGADLKARMLEQVNLIYTQGEQDAQEKTLARRMIADFLAKSTYKKEVFGDGTDTNTGLLGQIIDNPEYYEQNKAIVQKIYDEYVKFDTQISDEAKSVIRDKLTILIGQPGTKTDTPTTPAANTSLWNKIKTKVGAIGPMILWILLAIIGLIGCIFIVRKIISSRSQGDHSGADHDDHSLPTTPDNGNHGADWMHKDDHDDHGLSTVPDDHSAQAGTPDWLKEPESSFGGDDVLAKEIKNTPEVAHDAIPTWMHDEHETVVTTVPAPEPTKTSEPSIPDWLQAASEPAPTTKEEIIAPTPVETTPEAPVQHDDIPDWLRGADTAPAAEVTAEMTPPAPIEATPSTEPSTTETPQDETPVEAPLPTSEENLPDWLRGTQAEEKATKETGITEEKENTISDVTPPTTVETPATEGTEKKKKKKSTTKGATEKQKLITEGDHLIGPGAELLPNPEHLVSSAGTGTDSDTTTSS